MPEQPEATTAVCDWCRQGPSDDLGPVLEYRGAGFHPGCAETAGAAAPDPLLRAGPA